MRVLVTGSDGYIGVQLVQHLLKHGHSVSGLDTGFYRDGWLFGSQCDRPVMIATLNKDLRRVLPADLEGFDAIVHLAELSNDPLGQSDPVVTEQINSLGSINLATMARAAGVARFVYASSCSVYGMASQDWVDEESSVNPQTAYARCKVRVESALQPISDDTFCVTFLRNATAYGASPRMRFDIVLNDLCALAWTTRKISMLSDGTPWRPIVHIDDICEAVSCVLAAPIDSVCGKIFNVGADSENYRIRDIASTVAEVFHGCEVLVGPSAGDTRSYRVSFRKIHEELPGFRTAWTASRGAQQLYELFERIQMTEGTYRFRAYTRLKQLSYLRETAQVDGGLFWRV